MSGLDGGLDINIDVEEKEYTYGKNIKLYTNKAKNQIFQDRYVDNTNTNMVTFYTKHNQFDSMFVIQNKKINCITKVVCMCGSNCLDYGIDDAITMSITNPHTLFEKCEKYNSSLIHTQINKEFLPYLYYPKLHINQVIIIDQLGHDSVTQLFKEIDEYKTDEDKLVTVTVQSSSIQKCIVEF